jgi:hypothetical protein
MLQHSKGKNKGRLVSDWLNFSWHSWELMELIWAEKGATSLHLYLDLCNADKDFARVLHFTCAFTEFDQDR